VIMSGICAVMGLNAKQTVKKLCQNLKHRGPDAEGYFFDEKLALGHRALIISTKDRANQPLGNEEETMWITFDGEIYNKQQMLAKLKKHHKLQTECDAEVVLHAYEEYDHNCLEKLNGIFAFCLWDSRKNTLFSARDRLGIKPLYYCVHQGQTIIASEMKAIIGLPSFPKEPNNHFICQYLMTGYPVRKGDTFLMGIKELLPAHYILISDKGSKIRDYWQLLAKTKREKTDDADYYAEEFLKILQDSVNIRLPKKLPVGIFLSGGLDSTSLVFLTERILSSKKEVANENRKLQELFSAIYEQPTEQGDETPYIKKIEEALKTQVNYVFPSVTEQWDDIKKFVFSIEEPVAVFNYYVFWCLFRAASEKVKVVLSGMGNDAILAGQTSHVLKYYRELLRKKKIINLLEEIFMSSDWILPQLVYSIVFSRNKKQMMTKLLSKDFLKAYYKCDTPKQKESLQTVLINDVKQHAVEYLRVDDRISAVFSMQCRYPYLDPRIVEFAFQIPSNQKIRHGWTKYVLRKAVKGIIPETIRKKRKKFGTPIPQQRWMRELRKNILELLESEKFEKRGYFNKKAVTKVFNLYFEGKLTRLEREYYANLLWRIINLELWLEIFIDEKAKLTS